MKSATLLLLLFALACRHGVCAERPGSATSAGRGVVQVGSIRAPAISESSGLAASRKHPGVFWTHNDKGRKASLFAVTREGSLLSTFKIEGPTLADWEDIAIDNAGHLYLGDLGNNDAKRAQLAVHQIEEPNPRSPGGSVRPTQTWRLRFPKKPFDCESLFVWQGFGYVISKVFKDQRAEIYRFPLTAQTEPFTLEWVARLPIDSPVTGADISIDGRQLGVVCKSGAYVFRIEGDVARAGAAAFHQTKFRHEHIEACCFVPDGLLATAESREIYLFTDDAFRPAR